MNPKILSKKNKIDDLFEDHLTTLFEELQLADRWHRPSILLVTYRSKLVLIDAQVCLEKKLSKLKQKVYHLDVDADNYDVALFLSQYPDLDKTIFFVSGLKNGGGPMGLNAYRALNIRRELLVDHHIRTVFWLTEEEATDLPMHALDFWSFRHRMVELLDQPTPERIIALVQALNWPRWNLRELTKEIPNGITLRKELLSEIPEWDEAPAIRAELIHMLAALYWAQGKYIESKDLLELGLGITQKFMLLPLQSHYWIAIGMVHHKLGDLDRAIDAYKNALKLDPVSADAWGNLGKAYQDQGHPSDAISAAKRSIELDPKIASTWNNLGDHYRDSERFEDAILAYKKSLAIDSKDAQIWVKLGDVYRSQGQPSNALQPYKKAKQLKTKDADAWINLGFVYHDLGFINSAVRAFYKATRLDPLSAIPWKNLGDIYRYTNRLKYARKAYKTASFLDPHDKTVLYSLKACYTSEKK